MLKRLYYHTFRLVLFPIALRTFAYGDAKTTSRYCVAANRPIGSTSCIQDKPTSTIKMNGLSAIRCGNLCDPSKACCLTYEYDEQNEECHFYNGVPTNWNENKTGCQSYYCSDGSTLDDSISCWFPFTLNGKLYYSCIVNSLVPCSVWCYGSDRSVRQCSPYLYDFTATTQTRNVTISSTVGVIPLKSVYGWVIVLSRIDDNFPYGLNSADYINGFGNIEDNFWLGIEKLYQLTTGSSRPLRFELQGNDGWWKSSQYNWFYMWDSVNGYPIRVSSSNYGDAYNAVYPINSKRFVFSGTTCSDTNGPWWYKSDTDCSDFHLLGSPETVYYRNIGTNSKPKIARMMVRI